MVSPNNKSLIALKDDYLFFVNIGTGNLNNKKTVEGAKLDEYFSLGRGVPTERKSGVIVKPF